MTSPTLTTKNGLSKSTQSLAAQRPSLNLRTMTRLKNSLIRSAKRTVILGDISGSMSGQKIHALRDTYATCWRPGVIGIVFNNEVYAIDQSDIAGLKASNFTSMGKALQAAWSEHADHIILITDGEPSDLSKNEILSLVRQHADTPIDTIGISEGPYDTSYDPHFLQELSSITKANYNSCDEPLQLTQLVEQLLIDAPKSSGDAIQL